MRIDREFWRAKSVFPISDTGFKGGWLATWLIEMGACVCGYALTPSTAPSYFVLCNLEHKLKSIIGNICDADFPIRSMRAIQPEVVFHLAAQPLVRRSYENPPETFSTNIGGRMPDYAVILPWNIAGEIAEQQQEYLRAAGRFIVPIPEPQILEHSA